MRGTADTIYSATDPGWGLKVLLVVALLVGLMALGYWLRGQVEAERRREHRPLCPRCQSPLSPPRPLPNGRRKNDGRRAAGPRVYGGPRPLPDARRRRIAQLDAIEAKCNDILGADK